MENSPLVWLIDDDPDELYLYQKAFSRQTPSFRIRSFDDSLEALKCMESLEEDFPALVVSDLNMPLLDGPGLFRRMEIVLQDKPLASTQFVIMSTSLPLDIPVRTQGIRRLLTVISKPDVPHDLANSLRGLL